MPPYRDLKIGRYLFVERAQFFRERGISEIVVSPRTKEFGACLTKVGFLPAASREEGSAFHIRFGH